VEEEEEEDSAREARGDTWASGAWDCSVVGAEVGVAVVL
jgi:hypothetical protein